MSATRIIQRGRYLYELINKLSISNLHTLVHLGECIINTQWINISYFSEDFLELFLLYVEMSACILHEQIENYRFVIF